MEELSPIRDRSLIGSIVTGQVTKAGSAAPIGAINNTPAAKGPTLDQLASLHGLTAEPTGTDISIAESLYELIKPPASHAALLQPSRLMTLLDGAIGALSDPAAQLNIGSWEPSSLVLAALMSELDHHRGVAQQRAEDRNNDL